jgi:adenosine deaminase
MKDLHLHLSGAASTRTLWQLIRESGYKTGFKSYHDFEAFTKMKKDGDFDEYLNKLHWIDKVQSSPLAIEACVYDAFVSSYLAGAEYLELRFNPTKRSQGGLIDLDSIITSAISGMNRAKTIFGINGGLTLCLGWDCTDEANIAVAKKAMQYSQAGVVGLDIAGPYAMATPESRELFTQLFHKAALSGLQLTCHAGELNHPDVEDELLWAITCLGVNRIGHGIQIVRYPRLMELAANRHILFEICPSSNLATGAAEDQELSGQEFLGGVFYALRGNGLRWQICTDSTYPLNTDIRKEHELAVTLMESIRPVKHAR